MRIFSTLAVVFGFCLIGEMLFAQTLSAQTKSGNPPANTPPAVHITPGDIQSTLREAPADSVADQQIRMIEVNGARVGVGVVHRSAKASQNAIIHDELTEIYHVLSGSGTLVTGGTLIKAERFPADSQTVKDLAGPSWRGTAIEKGVSRKIGPGDVVIIPAGTAHWFSSIDGAIDYEVMRTDPKHLLSLK